MNILDILALVIGLAIGSVIGNVVTRYRITHVKKNKTRMIDHVCSICGEPMSMNWHKGEQYEYCPYHGEVDSVVKEVDDVDNILWVYDDSPIPTTRQHSSQKQREGSGEWRA